MGIARTIGALLVLVGGALDVVRLVIANEGVILDLGATQLVLNFVPLVVIGAGLVVVGFTLLGRSRVAVIIAGIFELLLVVLGAVEIAAASPFGSALSQFADYLSFIAVIVAAVFLLIDRTERGPIRWGLAVPAGCIVVFLITLFTLPVLWFDLLPGVGFMIAGVLLSRAAVVERGVGSTEER